MDLSPNDIRTFKFKTQMRGYNREEVESLIGQVATCVEELKQQQIKLTTENESLKSQLAGLKQYEDNIKNAAIDARRNADLTIAEAKSEAEKILAKADQRAQEMLEERQVEMRNVEDNIKKLELAKKAYLGKLRNMISNHLEMIDELVTSEPIGKNDPSQPQAEESVTTADAPTMEVEQSEVEPVSAEQESPEDDDSTFVDKPVDEIVTDVTADDDVDEVTKLKTQPEPQAAASIDDEARLTESLRRVVKDEQEQAPTAGMADDQIKSDNQMQPPPQPDELKRSEDLDATGPITEDIQAMARQAEKASSESPSGVMDPELAAALSQYQKDHADRPQDEGSDKVAGEDALPGVVIDEPTIPEGFITPDKELAQSDTAEIPSEDSEAATDDSDSIRKKSDASFDPENLASALDSVAAKFEEEMDRASRS